MYAEIQAILASRHLAKGEDTEALSRVGKAAKVFETVCDPTVHSAYFALESIVDAVLEVSNKDGSGLARASTAPSPTPNRSRSKSKSMSRRSRGGVPGSDRMAEKLALHAQCYLILAPRITEAFIRWGVETHLPDWMRAGVEKPRTPNGSTLLTTNFDLSFACLFVSYELLF